MANDAWNVLYEVKKVKKGATIRSRRQYGGGDETGVTGEGVSICEGTGCVNANICPPGPSGPPGEPGFRGG